MRDVSRKEEIIDGSKHRISFLKFEFEIFQIWNIYSSPKNIENYNILIFEFWRFVIKSKAVIANYNLT